MNDDRSGLPGRPAPGRDRRVFAPLAAALLSITLWLPTVVGAQHSTPAFQSVPEGQTPQGILTAARASRSGSLSEHPAGRDAVRALTSVVSERWQDICALDVVSLSRFHVEATRGWQAPGQPTFNGAELLAADDDALYLMVRGPRLPASFEIVYRYLVFYARYELATGQLADVSVSIHGEVHE